MGEIAKLILQVLALVFLVAGCAGPQPVENLPTYPWVDDATALKDLCHRSKQVQTLSSECAMTLTRPNGQSIRFDGAVVMSLPDSVRLRAWKMGQTAFDLTITPRGAWVEAPLDPDRPGQLMPGIAGAEKMGRALSILSGEFFCSARIVPKMVETPQIRMHGDVDGHEVACEVDRHTLTPRDFEFYDSDNRPRFSLRLDHYTMIHNVPWPLHITARSDDGVIEVELKDPELNGELAPNAFIPPKLAKKVP